jgi:cellobiose phosphorylase
MSDKGWHFTNQHGTFALSDPQKASYLYFPLVNEAGMMASISPSLNGDAKADQDSYLLLPVSSEDMHNSRSGRNFWVLINDEIPWSATGNSAGQTAASLSPEKDIVSLRAGILWQTVTRRHLASGLEAEITNFVPTTSDRVELMRVKLTNPGDTSLKITPTAAIPIFARSADNLRDHRHVTSLLQRTTCHPAGILVQPTLIFAEGGHIPNTRTYAVLGVDAEAPVGFFPMVEEFIGEGGNLDWPISIIRNRSAPCLAGARVDGYESMGGIRFVDVVLGPGEERTYIMILGILDETETPEELLEDYGSPDKFDQVLRDNQTFWSNKINLLQFKTADQRFNQWLRWVTLQPILRKLMGNSFLPYHDYGRGGRGWRDLWQDSLAILMMEKDSIEDMLHAQFGGVRMDGSNATIIGAHPGEFKADRNNIARVWMDHGAWPLLTIKHYLDHTGDLNFLLREQAYFKDHHSHRCRQLDKDWHEEEGTVQRTIDGKFYYGTILEHLLIQHLTAFFNVGDHNMILLEDADWNDGLDMGRPGGESVAFTALYAGNLRILGELCLSLDATAVEECELANELLPFFGFSDATQDNASIHDKRKRLKNYFTAVQHAVSGQKTKVKLTLLAEDLFNKSDWLTKHIRDTQWCRSLTGDGWFNGYYDADGQQVEGELDGTIRMTLTGQVFNIMCDIADVEQVESIVRAVDKHLYDEEVGGPRLNTDFKKAHLKLGRALGYAYGHKENGAMFSHMAVMYANALFKRGFVTEGWKVLEGIYQHTQDFNRCRIYPGIPEYINPRGRGMYPYLTGSAAWYLMTMLNEVFGVRGHLGDLVLDPKLLSIHFDSNGKAAVHTIFEGKSLEIIYRNPDNLDFSEYRIGAIQMNGKSISPRDDGRRIIIPRSMVNDWPPNTQVEVTLISNA